MSPSLKSHVGELCGFGVSTLGVLTARQEEIEWWLRCAGSAVAIFAGLLTIRSLLRKK